MYLRDTKREPVWVPSAEGIDRTQLTAFIRFCEAVVGTHFLTSEDFYQFSILDFRLFWRLFLDWSNLPYSGDASVVCQGNAIERSVFFPDVTLNYAEVLLADLSNTGPDSPAILAYHPDRPPSRLTRAELRQRVAAAALALQALHIGAESRVAVIAANHADTVVGVLAAAALGATIAMAAPDMGVSAMLERLSQVEPVMLICDWDSPVAAAQPPAQERMAMLVQGLPSLRSIVLFGDQPPEQRLAFPVHHLATLAAEQNADAFTWRRLPFNHPLFVLFTSGTTGAPKCILHGAGGSLIEHLKEHRLHCDLRPGDKLFFQTSTAWMMWQWQLSALAAGVEIVLNDAPVIGPETLWQIVAAHHVTVFGTSPAYIHLCESANYHPAAQLVFPALRSVLSTGSILYDRQQEWLTQYVKALPILSISGGSDIIGCFVLGNPIVPAYRAECQSRSLGLDVQALGAPPEGPLAGIGELVCANPFPSRPLGFLNDPAGTRFHTAYFSQNPGFWTHGDLIAFTPEGSARLLGRSDGVMNIKGIRIGPAELYHAIADIHEVQAALAVEQNREDIPGNARIVLIVKLRKGAEPTPQLFEHIARTISRRTSPAHVPAVIIDAPELPTTLTGKLSERSAHDAVNGRLPANAASLRNAGCLAAIANHPALQPAPQTNVRREEVLREHSVAGTLQAIWEMVLKRGPIGHEDDIFDLDGNSLAVISILRQVEKTFGITLPVAAIFTTRTIARMAALIEAMERPVCSSLVLQKEGDDRPALFMIHGLGGTVIELVGLGRRIHYGGAVYAVQARGLTGADPPNARVEDMARDYISAIRSIQPHGPYCLAGHSFGGLVAFEMARSLLSKGEPVGYVGLLDTILHKRYWSLYAWVDKGLRRTRDEIGKLGNRPFKDTVRAALARPSWGGAASDAGAGMRQSDIDNFDDLPPVLRAVYESAEEAFVHYNPGFYDGTLSLIRCDTVSPWGCDPVLNWRSRCRHLNLYRVPCKHSGMVLPPGMDFVAQALSTGLAAAMPQAPQSRR